MATVPVIEASDVTATSQVDATSWPVNFPDASTGDLLIACVIWDDSANVTSVTTPTGPNGETFTSIQGPRASANTEMRMQVWYTIATGSWTAGTLTFTPSAQEQAHAYVIKVLAGEFDSATPIGASSGASSATTSETDIVSPAFSAGASDTDGRLVIMNGADGTGDITIPGAGYTSIASASPTTAVNIMTRDAGVTSAESIAASTSTLAVADSWASIAFIVRPAQTTASTVTPITATITLSGNIPSLTAAFSNVRIREVLVNASGQPITNGSDITLLVWYSGRFGGAPDVSINDMTTDSAGTASWSIPTGTLIYQQLIAYVAQSEVSLSHYTAARMTPSYE